MLLSSVLKVIVWHGGSSIGNWDAFDMVSSKLQMTGKLIDDAFINRSNRVVCLCSMAIVCLLQTSSPKCFHAAVCSETQSSRELIVGEEPIWGLGIVETRRRELINKTPHESKSISLHCLTLVDGGAAEC